MVISSAYSIRRTRHRYLTLVGFIILLFGSWSGFWYYTSNQSQHAIERWRVREAQAGHVYTCGKERIGGYPFRIEVDCESPLVLLQGARPSEIKTARAVIAWQIYEPTLLISEISGPLTITESKKGQPTFIANWSSARSSLRGRPRAPEHVSLVLDNPSLDSAGDRPPISLLRAKHLEVHGRLVQGSTTGQPVIETAVQLEQASIPGLHIAASEPIDANVLAILRGVPDFATKPWGLRLRDIQAVGGRIDITQARVQQGDVLAVGNGTLSLNNQGRLDGQLRVTVAGVDQFLKKVGAQQLVQESASVNKLAGALDRVVPGLGRAARERAGANISAGINILGEQTILEGRYAVKLLLRFDDGVVFLGPIRIGKTPDLF